MVICEKFINRGLPLIKIDEKFLFYTEIIDSMEKIVPYHDIGPIRINLNLLINSICEHATEWKNTLGGILAEKVLQNIKGLRNHIKASAFPFYVDRIY